MQKCADIVINWMIKCDAINDVDKDLYKYAMNSFILLIVPFILAGGIGFYMGSVKYGVGIIFPFVVLRKFSGGYHAKNMCMCILGSVFLLSLCISLSMYVKCDLKLATVTTIASVSLILFSPIEHTNRRFDNEEKRMYKKMTVFFVILFGLLDIIFYGLGKYTYTICFSVGILLTAGLQIPYVVKKVYLRLKMRCKCTWVKK